MPQMMPLFWMNLFLLFMLFILIIYILIYFFYTPSSNSKTYLLNKTNWNWSW